MSHRPIPLCVDLDGTLIHSDLLLETFLLLIKRNPLYFFLVPFWLLRGRAALKAEIAKRVNLNPAALPYNDDFLTWLLQEKAAGRSLWLCTASNYRFAESIANHVDIFDGVLASSDDQNISGQNKARSLAEKFGEKAFDYCGNHRIDLAIWQVSRVGIIVSGGATLETQARSVAEITKTFPRNNKLLRATLNALRLHQWTKNLLIFVPLAAAHKLSDAPSLLSAIFAFFTFGLCASSVYLLNDMLDLEVDRQQPRKKRRPFAAGDLSLLVGFALVPILLIGAFSLALQLPTNFLLVLAGYYLLTIAYSFGLKGIVLVDTITLAGLYAIRIVAGAAAVGVPLSFWLLLISIFLFLSLALVKRYAELETMRRQGKLKAAGRGYLVEDLPILHSLGTAAGYLSVLILALYINTSTAEALYKHPKAIWLLCVLLLYWISYVWLKAHRGTMNDDPVVFALKDKTSLGVALLAAVTIFLAV